LEYSSRNTVFFFVSLRTTFIYVRIIHTRGHIEVTGLFRIAMHSPYLNIPDNDNACMLVIMYTINLSKRQHTKPVRDEQCRFAVNICYISRTTLFYIIRRLTRKYDRIGISMISQCFAYLNTLKNKRPPYSKVRISLRISNVSFKLITNNYLRFNQCNNALQRTHKSPPSSLIAHY